MGRKEDKLCNMKEVMMVGGKNITFLTYDGTFGAIKGLTFIQKFDSIFGKDGFFKSSKLQNVSMHLFWKTGIL